MVGPSVSADHERTSHLRAAIVSLTKRQIAYKIKTVHTNNVDDTAKQAGMHRSSGRLE
jgi:hypothetical protein